MNARLHFNGGIVLRGFLYLLTFLSLATSLFAGSEPSQRDAAIEMAQRAYDASDYSSAVLALRAASTQNPQNARIYFLLAKSYYQLHQYDAAVENAEKAVARDPDNSLYHEWLGNAYGAKAEHSNRLSALSLARKTRKEFEKATLIDNRNFTATQALIQFDCAAPGIAGGGTDKADREIQQLAAINAAQGYYAAGNCARQKKDFTVADSDFTQALQAGLGSTVLISEIGDYAVERNQPERLMAVMDAGEKLDPSDPRWKFYRAVALIMNGQFLEMAKRQLSEYLQDAPSRSGFPSAAAVHYWLGRRFEDENSLSGAIDEYAEALHLDPNYQMAKEAMKRIKKASPVTEPTISTNFGLQKP